MNISNDTPSMDYLAYFTNQMPKDLAHMAALRDELAQRQGALSAVVEANQDRKAAKLLLENATAEAAALVADTKAKNTIAKQKLADVEAKELAFNLHSAEIEASLTSKADALVMRENQLSANKTSLAAFQTMLDGRAAKLDADRVLLDNRVKAFQDKVAALSV